MEVLETKDSNIKEHNMETVEDLPNGEIKKGEVGKKVLTRELESGKTMPVSGGIAQRPAQQEVASNESGEIRQISAPPTNSVGKDASPTRIVEVYLAQYKKCKIGKKWYEFHPNRSYKVPETVKAILKRSGALGVL